jgi:hypothetical protein
VVLRCFSAMDRLLQEEKQRCQKLLRGSIPTAIGRSKLGPSFFTSAGARLIVVRPMGGE